MASCGRKDCMKCSEAPRCRKGWKCPKCHPRRPADPKFNRFSQRHKNAK